MEKLEQLIVKDLNEHRGLSVDTIVKMSNTIENIKDFRLLTNIIKGEFKGLNSKYKASVGNKSPILQKSVYIDQQETTPLRKPNKKQKTNYQKTRIQLNAIRRAEREKYERRLQKKQKSKRSEEENTRNRQTKKKQKPVEPPVFYF